MRPEEVRDFLLQKKAEGYTVIALEQTAHSKPLQAFSFPDRVCVLLGKEKEGVPLELLSLVDMAVEIPQFGIIRSLNVHVSASVLIWEYTKQQIQRAKAAAAVAASAATAEAVVSGAQ